MITLLRVDGPEADPAKWRTLVTLRGVVGPIWPLGLNGMLRRGFPVAVLPVNANAICIQRQNCLRSGDSVWRKRHRLHHRLLSCCRSLIFPDPIMRFAVLLIYYSHACESSIRHGLLRSPEQVSLSIFHAELQRRLALIFLLKPLPDERDPGLRRKFDHSGDHRALRLTVR